MKLLNAISANVLTENAMGELKAIPITLHIDPSTCETRDEHRERIFDLVTDHYQPEHRVVSITFLEQATVGKRAISMRRDPLNNNALEVCETIRVESGFRLGGPVLDLTTKMPALH